MRKVFTVILFFGGALLSMAQGNVPVNGRHINSDVVNYTLLVVEYEKMDSTSVAFSQRSISDSQVKAFVEEENKHIEDYNKKLFEYFKKYYKYNFQLVPEKKLDYVDKVKYPYVLMHTAIKIVPNSKPADKGHFSYSYSFYDRINDKRLADINIHHANRWHSLKVILQELTDYLESQTIEE